jgi:hypothetical protein
MLNIFFSNILTLFNMFKMHLKYREHMLPGAKTPFCPQKKKLDFISRYVRAEAKPRQVQGNRDTRSAGDCMLSVA